MVIAVEKFRRIADGGGAVRFGRALLSSAARVYPGAPWMVQNPSLLPDTPIPRHRDLGSCLDVDRCSLIIERSADHPTYATDPTGLYEGGSAFTQGTGSYGSGSGGSNSLIAPWLNLGSGGAGNSVNASPTSLTNTGNAFGGQGPITAPTSVGTSSGFGGAGSYSSGNNSISFNLGAGPSNQGLSSLAPSVYDSMGGGGGVSFASNIPSAASSAAYFQNLSQQYAPSLFGSTTLGSGAYGLGQSEVNGAVNAWNYLSSNAPALAEHPSALGPGMLQGGANLVNSVQNFAIGVANSAISANNLLNMGADGIAGLFDHGAAPFGMVSQIPYANWSNNVAVQNDPAHGVEMGLNAFGLTGLSAGAGAIPGMVGYVSNAGDIVDSATVASQWTAPQGLRLPVSNGDWAGTPGNSLWKSYLPEVNQITGNRAILFNQGNIDLSYYKLTQYSFPNLTGTNSDFALADQQLAIDQGLSSANAAKVWRYQNELTWHHVEDGQTLQLVPRVLNDIPHQGGAAILRGQ